MSNTADLQKYIDNAGIFAGGGLQPRMGKVENKQPSGSCELTGVDDEGNWVQMMNPLQGSGVPGQGIGGVPVVGSPATFGSTRRGCCR